MSEESRHSSDGVSARYNETETERRLELSTGDERVVLTQNRDGYAMVSVRDGNGSVLEKYYGFDMALDHAGEVLGVNPTDLPVPAEARDIGL